VNNGDIDQHCSGHVGVRTRINGITVEWCDAEENVLRQRVTTTSRARRQFDILDHRTYECQICARGWLLAADRARPPTTSRRLLPGSAPACRMRAQLFAAPFYGESSMTSMPRYVERAG